MVIFNELSSGGVSPSGGELKVKTKKHGKKGLESGQTKCSRKNKMGKNGLVSSSMHGFYLIS